MKRHPEDEALTRLLNALAAAGYEFIAVTPDTHARVVARKAWQEARDLRGVFGWNLPFQPRLLPPAMLDMLRQAEMLEEAGEGRLKSRIRVASLADTLFLHSSFPTDAEDSVFFGPDTYRFAELLSAEVPRLGPVRRLVDLGAGTGAGGIVAARLLPGARATLVDVNPAALRLARINARHAGVDAELVEGGSLDAVEGAIDLVVANPPYVMDEAERAYRNGGGLHGAQLSLDWALAAARRLDPGGHLLLYTGVAIVDGKDAFKAALERQLPQLGCSLRYREIDPDIFGEELDEPPYREVERIAAVAAVVAKA
jgi:methylase of polypeptide subunit release factors